VVASKELQAEFEKAKELIDWIDSKIDGVTFNGEPRNTIPAILFHLAIEHYAGITQLLISGIYGSACALVRCELECFVRGAWLHYCADDAQLEAFSEKDKIIFNENKKGSEFDKMIEVLEKRREFQGKFLSKKVKEHWNAMNGFTHGGIHQISRRRKVDRIEANFDDVELIEVARFSGMIALFALEQIAALGGRQDIVNESGARFKGNFLNLPPLPQS
jgi:hypothetical protein